MSDVVAFYQQQAAHCLSSIPWLAKAQSEAWSTFMRLGFPGRRHEEWKYTPVDFLQQQLFSPAPEQSTSSCASTSDVPVQTKVLIHNGSLVELPHGLPHVPKGVLVLSLQQALTEHSELLKPYLTQILHQEHGVHALNTALIQCGVVIYIPKGVSIEEPIALIHHQDHDKQATHLRHVIIAESGSKASIIEEYSGIEDATYCTNTITELFLGEHAQLTHYKLQREGKRAVHLGHLAVRQAASSHFSSHSLSLGAALARSDISIQLQEEHATCLMNGIYAPTQGQHVDHHTLVHHLVPHCSSEQDYKGVLKGRSRAVFNGKVVVAKGAQHTQARQQNKNLLLSPDAEIDTKPQLEIFADDVQCTHGATVGQLDEEALFYLASRGLDRLVGAHYLIRAFAADNLKLIPNRALADWMSHLLMQQLG